MEFSQEEVQACRDLVLIDFSRQRRDAMAYLRKMGRKRSKRVFRKSASRTHRKNISPRPMRGGIRL